MSEASVLAGISADMCGSAGCHACSYPLTYLYDLRHGAACAFTLDSFTRINAEAEEGRLHLFAKQVGFENAYSMADRIKLMKNQMGMKTTLREVGIDINDIDNLAILSMQPDMINNPVAITINKLIEMYNSLK